MDLVPGLDSLPLPDGPTAATIGFFDGVHRGHQAVIGRTAAVARARGLRPVAVTFDRHPLETLSPGKAPKLLTTLSRRVELIGRAGAEAVLVLEFTEEFSVWSPEEFVERVLVHGLRAEHAVIGSNFTFGHKAMGNIAVLSELGGAMGFTVEGVALLKLDGRGVSSTSIREALRDGDLAWPERALGRPYAVDGRVVRGAGRGAKLGWPTANLQADPPILLPGDGVYAGRVRQGDRWHVAAINVGGNPTFGQEPVHVEAFLLDFEGDIVGEEISIEFRHRLRDELRFETPEALSEQIAADVDRTRELIAAEPGS